jgi:predicted transcriptional regulator
MYVHNGQQLKQILETRGIRPAEFARRVQTSRQWLNAVMKTQMWRTPTLLTIATALKVPPARFFKLIK